MEQYINEQQAALDTVLWRFFDAHKELFLNRIVGRAGLEIVADTSQNINIRTYGAGKAYYNGVEIGTGAGGGSYLPLAGGSMIGDISHLNSVGDKYFDAGAGSNYSGEIRSWVGDFTTHDFLIRAVSGVLDLVGASGISFQSNIVSDVTIQRLNPILTIKGTNPGSSLVVRFVDSANNIDGSIYTVSTNAMVVNCTYGALWIATSPTTGGEIYLAPKNTARVTINDTSMLLTYGVPLCFTNTGTNITNTTDDMVFTVKNGKKFKFVVSP